MLTLTNNAISKVKSYATQNEKYKDKSLRIFIQGGGCSGFQYGFAFDEEREGDQIIQTDDVKVLVDSQSAQYLAGSKVDYLEDINGSGFIVDNPNSTGSCGCGTSVSFNNSNSGGGCGSGGCC